MLNITANSINHLFDKSKFKSFDLLNNKSVSNYMLKILLFMGIIMIAAMFLPWTQNVRSKGYVTTVNPYDRPQNIEALLGGRVEQWYVKEGQSVAVGDTILKISEVKEEYLDPEILDRTQGQIKAKTESASAYLQKSENLRQQYNALKQGLAAKLEQNDLKIKQIQFKITSDSMNLVAARAKLDIAKAQLKRIDTLYSQGIKSLTDLEAKRLSQQESAAKVIALENKINAFRNDLKNLQVNKATIQNDYLNKMAKSESDRMSALSNMYDSQANVDKLQSSFNSYSVRQQNYIITSPINGIVTKALQSGIGEIIKAGDKIVSIIPDTYELGVEMYVEPMDMPLLAKGQRVMVQFDGWPAIVFSGWPNSSYGTFVGQIFAIDQFISDNGKYRIMVQQDPDENPWPEQVRIGGGANTITLLKDVSVGYELWRQLNGFPPDYYEPIENNDDIKNKAPLRKVK